MVANLRAHSLNQGSKAVQKLFKAFHELFSVDKKANCYLSL